MISTLPNRTYIYTYMYTLTTLERYTYTLSYLHTKLHTTIIMEMTISGRVIEKPIFDFNVMSLY